MRSALFFRFVSIRAYTLPARRVLTKTTPLGPSALWRAFFTFSAYTSMAKPGGSRMRSRCSSAPCARAGRQQTTRAIHRRRDVMVFSPVQGRSSAGVRHQPFQRLEVAGDSLPHDPVRGHFGDHADAPPRLALRQIREMDLDDPESGGYDRIAQRVRVVRVRPRVEDHAVGPLAHLV